MIAKSSDWKKHFLINVHQLRKRKLSDVFSHVLQKAESFALNLGSDIPEPEAEFSIKSNHVRFSWEIPQAKAKLFVYINVHSKVEEKLTNLSGILHQASITNRNEQTPITS